MKTIENRPAAIQGHSEFGMATFGGAELQWGETRRLWAVNRAPGYTSRRPAAFLPAIPQEEANEALRRDFADLVRHFECLPLDNYLRNGATFRYRRFGRYALRAAQPLARPDWLADRLYFQSESINNYAGGIQRRFEPLGDELAVNAYLLDLIVGLFNLMPLADRELHEHWEAGVHPTRVVGSASEAGYGAPEGLHQDGHVFASTVLIGRRNVNGGDSIFADPSKVIFWQRPLLNPGDAVLWRDAACWHDVTEILPESPHRSAVRDIVGISFNPLRS